jgi:predicted oxidoreductase
VGQSFASSLEHLRTTYLDSYVLHGPSSHRGLTSGDWTVWRAMEGLHAAGRIRLIGVSNVSLEQLENVHAPIGLDIGAVTPQEIAVAIVAELIAVRRSKTDKVAGASLRWMPKLHVPARP